MKYFYTELHSFTTLYLIYILLQLPLTVNIICGKSYQLLGVCQTVTAHLLRVIYVSDVQYIVMYLHLFGFAKYQAARNLPNIRR